MARCDAFASRFRRRTAYAREAVIAHLSRNSDDAPASVLGRACRGGRIVAAAVRVRGQQPSFKTEAEALAVDVNVLDGSGTPVPGLGAADFDVRVDGRQRRVVNVQWISGEAPAAAAPGGPLQIIPAGYASNQSPTHQSGHLVVIASTR